MQKVMNIYILKITGLAILVLVVAIGIYVLWPAKPTDERQISQKEVSTSTIQLSADNIQPKRQLTPQDFQPAATSKLQDRNPRLQQHRRRTSICVLREGPQIIPYIYEERC